MPDYIIRQRDRGQADAKTSRPRPRPKFWPRGHFGLEDLTSLQCRTTATTVLERVAICVANIDEMSSVIDMTRRINVYHIVSEESQEYAGAQ